jgi:hypothetical protein
LRNPNVRQAEGSTAAENEIRTGDERKLLDRALVERVLDGLGPPRWVWRLAWGVLPFVTLAITAGFERSIPGTGATAQLIAWILPAAALGYVVVLFLWGCDRLLSAIRGLDTTLRSLEGSTLSAGRWSPTRARLPVVAALLLAMLDGAERLGGEGIAGAVLAGVPDFLAHLPVTTFAWAYFWYLLALDRLGRERLMLDVFPEDRSLGLAPLGAVAFLGFGVVIGGIVPLLIANATDLQGALLSAGGLGVAVAALFLSMWRLHQQMAAAKKRYVDEARALYAQAYGPIRHVHTVDALRDNASTLSAAQALEQRAQSIYEWPLDERTSGRLAVIVTGVVTGVIVRLLTLGLH